MKTKKIILMAALIFVFAIPFANASIIDGFRQIRYNGNFILNTTSNLDLRTNDTTRIYITPFGLVGIGTTSPLSALHINVTDNFNKSVTNILTLDHVLKNPVNASGGIGVSIQFRASDNASQMYKIANISAILTNTSNGSQQGALVFSVLNGSGDNGDNSNGHLMEMMRIVNGSIGIGTTGPGAKLDVAGKLLSYNDYLANFQTFDSTVENFAYRDGDATTPTWQSTHGGVVELDWANPKTTTSGSWFAISSISFTPQQYPFIEFDYKYVNSGFNAYLMVKDVNDPATWHTVRFKPNDNGSDWNPVGTIWMKTNGDWHHAVIPIAEFYRNSGIATTNTITQVIIGNWLDTYTAGDAIQIDNFRITATPNYNFPSFANNYVTITDTGSVGIGTTSPDNLLTLLANELTANAIFHINASDNYNKSVTNLITLDHVLKNPVNASGGIGVSIQFRASDNASQMYKIANISAILTNTSNGSQQGALIFSVLNGSDTGDGSFGHLTEMMRITSNKTVGIGTSIPLFPLTVVGTVNATRLNGTLDCTMIGGGSDGDFCTDASGSADASVYNRYSNLTFDLQNFTGRINFSNNTAINQTLFIINGLVGIGTIRPNKLLEVNVTSPSNGIATNGTLYTSIINTTRSDNITISSAAGSVIIRLG